MYYIARIVFIIVLMSAAWFLERRYLKKQVAKGKQYTLRQLRTLSISIRLFALLLSVLVFFIPFEAPFMHFDTVEASLSYKWIDTKEISVCVEDDCAFAVKGPYDIFAFDRSAQGFGFVNYHSTKTKYYTSDGTKDNEAICNLYSIYNKTANKTFYILNLRIDKYQEELLKSTDIEFEYLANPMSTNGPLFGSFSQVYAIKEGKPIPEVHITYNDKNKTFTQELKLYINVSNK